MRLRAALMLVIALALGAGAVFLARDFISEQIASNVPTVQPQQIVETAPKQTIVVAATALRFGNRIGREHIKEVAWAADVLPSGSFKTVEELLAGDEQRVVLQAMEPNEPVLATKITGPGQRASLSAIIEEGMRAVTIRVNDVLGVAGFVLPADRVDILLTREFNDQPITDVLLQNVKVLGIDQLANEKANEPQIVKAVTLEVTTEQAQKLALGSEVGVLSLALRDVVSTDAVAVKRVTLRDLSESEANIAPLPDIVAPATQPEIAQPEPPKTEPKRIVNPSDSGPRVGITRGLVRQEYEVRREGT